MKNIYSLFKQNINLNLTVLPGGHFSGGSSMSYWPRKQFLICFLRSAADSTLLILFGISFHTLAPLYEKALSSKF